MHISKYNEMKKILDEAENRDKYHFIKLTYHSVKIEKLIKIQQNTHN